MKKFIVAFIIAMLCAGYGFSEDMGNLIVEKETSFKIGHVKFDVGTLLATPEAGMIEYDGCSFFVTNVATQKALDRTSDVVTETVTVSNQAAETVLFQSNTPANSFCAGNLSILHADGVVSNNGNNADNDFTLRVRCGGLTGTEIISLTPSTKAMTGEHWHLDINFTQRTIGVAGSRAVHLHLQVGDADEEKVIDIVTINTEENMDCTITVDWVTAHANNTISMYQGYMSYKN